MKRWLPSPWLSLALFAGWALLSRSTDAATLALGAMLALGVPRLSARLRPSPGALRRWGTLAWLILRVGRDVVRSAIEVALGVLRLPLSSASKMGKPLSTTPTSEFVVPRSMPRMGEEGDSGFKF